MGKLKITCVLHMAKMTKAHVEHTVLLLVFHTKEAKRMYAKLIDT